MPARGGGGAGTGGSPGWAEGKGAVLIVVCAGGGSAAGRSDRLSEKLRPPGSRSGSRCSRKEGGARKEPEGGCPPVHVPKASAGGGCRYCCRVAPPFGRGGACGVVAAAGGECMPCTGGTRPGGSEWGVAQDSASFVARRKWVEGRPGGGRLAAGEGGWKGGRLAAEAGIARPAGREAPRGKPTLGPVS